MVDRINMGPGSSGPFVRDLQLALNAGLMPSPNLVIDGTFNSLTQSAVLAFQEANWLHPNEQCDQATLDCLYGAEAYGPIQHNLRHLAQPGPQTGWAAMVAMLRGVAPSTALATVPPDLAAQYSDPAMGTTNEARQALARLNGLTLHAGLSLTVSRLIEALRARPVGLERVADIPESGRAESRFLVVAGARGSHGGDGTTTTLRLYDPDTSQQGGVYSLTYAALVRRQPGTRFAMFTP